MIAHLVGRFYDDLWNQWDDSAVEEVLAPDFRFRGSWGDSVEGPAGWRGYRDSVRTGSADFHNEVVELLVDGDRAAARLEYSGTHTGPMRGIAATGLRFGYAGAAFFTAAEGRLTSAWVLGDLTGLESQLRGRSAAV